MSVDNSTKLTWCENQVGFCLQYICQCINGIVPNASDVQQCIHGCPLSNNGCYADCNKRCCAAASPKKYNQTIATSVAPSASATNGPQISSLPPGFFGNAGNTNRGVLSWTAVGGSSVLGLVVFLTVGMMFGNNHMD
ncbi:MAG: hypothetical protein J3Q66DRAFT_365549 [Benniella sp.]|nr:MAG: hypothetical protein J3Q66DRAFT_365549 [Benniella sp.]